MLTKMISSFMLVWKDKMIVKNKDDFKNIYEWKHYIGKYGEVRFAEECAKRNIVFIPPPNSQLPYDGVIEMDNVLKKVQIKAVTVKNGTQNVIHIKKGHGKAFYSLGDMEYFAVYFIKYDMMYLIPADVIFKKIGKKTRISLYDKELGDLRVKNKTTLDISQYKYW